MKCSEIKDLLGNYLDDELTQEMRNRVNRHLVRCRDCAWEVKSIEEAVAALRAASPDDRPAPEFRERLLEAALAKQRAYRAGMPYERLEPGPYFAATLAPGMEWEIDESESE
jgi:anti-sigma factor RsiW